MKTSTTYSTEVLTTYTTEFLTLRQTSFSTVVYPPPPDIVVKWEYWRWYIRDTNELTKVEIVGNVTNRSKIWLMSVRLDFEVSEGYKSESFSQVVSYLDTGQRRDFRFDYTPQKAKYDMRYTVVRYKGFEYFTGEVIQKTTMTQTSIREEVSQFAKTITLTTTRMILSTYTEPGFSLTGGSLMIVAVVAVAAVAIVVAFILRGKSAGKTLAPSTVQPQIKVETTPKPSETEKICPKCQTSNELGAKFCIDCGYKF